MVERSLATPNPDFYRFAVFCCSFKLDLGDLPDHALALFVDEAMARRYGAWMWPETYQVIDRLAAQEGAH